MKPFLYLFLFSLLIAIFGLFVGVVAGGFSIMPFSSFFVPGPGVVGVLVNFCMILTLGIPLVGLFYFFSRKIRPYYISTGVRRGSKFIWMTAFFVTVYGVIDTLLDHRTKNTDYEVSTFEITGDTIDFNVVNPKGFQRGLLQFEEYRYTGDKVYSDDYIVTVKKTKDPLLTVERRVDARGRSDDRAIKYARQVNHDLSFDGRELRIPSQLWLNNGDKIRGQWVSYTIYVPEGKHLTFDNRANSWHFDMEFSNEVQRPRDFNQYDDWVMTDSGLLSQKWSEETNYQEKVSLNKLETLNVKGDYTIEIIQGKKNELLIYGHKSEVENIEVIDQGEIMTISSEAKCHFPIHIIVRTPHIAKLSSSTNKSIRIEGFKQNDMEVILTEDADLQAFVEVDNLHIIGDKLDELSLTGKGENLILEVNRYTEIEAEDYQLEKLVLSHHVPRGKVNVEKLIHSNQSISKRLRVYGSPEIKIGKEIKEFSQ